MKTPKKNDTVTWKWGNGNAEGTVESVHRDSVDVQSHGKKITRNGSDDDPAIVIIQSDGTKVLKLVSELGS